MFLLPAVIACCSDAMFLYLYFHSLDTFLRLEQQQQQQQQQQQTQSQDEENNSSLLFYKSNRLHMIFLCLCITSIIRLLLLFIPLPYHVSMGTRIQNYWRYMTFHLVCFVFVGSLLISCLVHPIPNAMFTTWADQRMMFRFLFFHGLSILLHFLLILHLRSTAPSLMKLTHGKNNWNPMHSSKSESLSPSEQIVVGMEDGKNHAWSRTLYSGDGDGGGGGGSTRTSSSTASLQTSTTMTTHTTKKRKKKKFMTYWIYDQYRQRRQEEKLFLKKDRLEWEYSKNRRRIPSSTESEEPWEEDEENEDDEKEEEDGQGKVTRKRQHNHRLWNDSRDTEDSPHLIPDKDLVTDDDADKDFTLYDLECGYSHTIHSDSSTDEIHDDDEEEIEDSVKERQPFLSTEPKENKIRQNRDTNHDTRKMISQGNSHHFEPGNENHAIPTKRIRRQKRDKEWKNRSWRKKEDPMNIHQVDTFDAENVRTLPRAQETNTYKDIKSQRRRDKASSSFWKSLSNRRYKSHPFLGLQSCFSENYDDFFTDLKARFQRTKSIWSDHLEEFTHRIQSQHFPIVGNSTGTMLGGNSLLNNLNHLTPFRALLHLYAYEEVFTNHKLDRAFPSYSSSSPSHRSSPKSGAVADLTLSFYAPQLLCFLLHNAYMKTGQLERWILEKCRVNVYFAHKCFWFIRSWCLRSCKFSCDYPSSSVLASSSSWSRHVCLTGPSTSQSNLDGVLVSRGIDAVEDSKANMGERVNSGGSLSSLLEGWGRMVGDSNNKDLEGPLSSEEYQLVESLLQRIIECGDQAARSFGHGKWMEDEQSIHTDSNVIPVLKISDKSLGANKTNARDAEIALPNNCTTECTSSGEELSSMKPIGTKETEQGSLFLRAPRFLDSLIMLADYLKNLPRSERTTELQNHLKIIETEFLPSNNVYVPVNNCVHRVCSIVVSESIAISTKERVPCIICLEVIDHEKTISSSPKGKQDASTGSPTSTARKLLSQANFNLTLASDYDILTSWYKTPRPPQRHVSLIDKMTNYTQLSLKRFREDIEDTIHQQDQRIFGGAAVAERYDDVGHYGPDSTISNYLDSPSTSNTATGTELVPTLFDRNEEIAAASDVRHPTPTKPPLPIAMLSLLPPRVSILRSSSIASKGFEDGSISFSATPTSSVPSSRSSSRPSSPVINLGQWTSSPNPTKLKVFCEGKVKRRTSGEAESLNMPSGMKKRVAVGGEGSLTTGSIIQEIPSFTERNVPPHEYGSTDCMVVSDIRTSSSRCKNLYDTTPTAKKTSSSKRPPTVVFKEDWISKQERIRANSKYGSNPNWRLLPILIKSNDDLRQEQLASQLIHCMASILARAKVPVWLYPYEIIALTYRGGIIEAMPDTISLDSLKRNDPNFTDLISFFEQHFGPPGGDNYEDAKANFVESLAAYSIVCFLLQIKDRHNGNILLDNKGHLIHIDFGFFFLTSPGKNSGFESAPFKLTREFVDVMDGPNSRTFSRFRELCCRTFLELRKNCYQITLLVEMLMEGNQDLNCFRGQPDVAVQELQDRFCLDLNDRACCEFVNSLVDDSLENWRTTWYDRYQRCFVGVM